MFLAADDKSKADASIKRLGKSGQDAGALRDALKSVQFERNQCLEALQWIKQELTKLGLSPAQAKQYQTTVDGVVNALRDHLTDADVTGAMRDVAGDPVRQSGSGKQFDHLNEVNDALASLKNARASLLRLRDSLARRQIEPRTLSSLLDPTLGALQRVILQVEKALKQVNP